MALTSDATRTDADAGLGPTIADLLGNDLPVRIECYDGTRVGAPDASTQLVVRSPDALRYIITAPGELGFARRVCRRRDRDRGRHLRSAGAA